jgi:hypothetical protein
MGEELVHRENRNRTRRKRPAADLPQIGVQWTLGAALTALAGYMVHAWLVGLIQPVEWLWLAILAVLCLLPFVLWFQTGMRHLPLGEGFAAMHLAYYVIPCLGPPQGKTEYYTGEIRIQALIGMVVFLGAFVISYGTILRWRRPMFTGLGVLRREINLKTVSFLFGAWVVSMLALQSGFIPDLGTLRNEFMSVLGALGSIAVVCLFHRLGQNRLEGVSRLWLFGGLFLGLAASFASGSLIYGATVLGAALLAFSLGRKRLPVIAIIASILVLGLLQLGKNDYRSAAFGSGEGEDYVEAPSGLVQAYRLWLGAAWNAFTKKSPSSSEALPLFERTSLIQVLALAMETVPNNKPYVYGASYGMLPKMMVPRIFWAGKLRATTPTEDLGIYLGIQTVEGSEFTGIAVGPPTEAWINFGWLGLAGAGAFLGFFFGYPARLSRNFQPQQIGWLLTCIFLVGSIDLEHSIPELCNSLLLTLFMGFILLFFISKQPAGSGRTGIPEKATAPSPNRSNA